MPEEVLFASGHLGFGDSRRRQEAGRYHFSLNMSQIVPGALMPVSLITLDASSVSNGAKIVKAVEWVDASDDKWLFWAAGEKVYAVQDAALVTDKTFTSEITDIALHEDGSGNEKLYAAFGDDAPISERARGDTTGTWTAASSLKASLLDSLDDGRLARTVPISGGSRSYNVSILPKGSSPRTGTWGGSIQVGRPSETITALTHIEDILIAVKEDGIYQRNPASNTFRNLTPNLQPHPDNGKGAKAVPGLGVLVPLANGQLILIDSSLRPRSVGPYDEALPDRNTPSGRITALTHYGHWVFAATDIGYRRTQNLPNFEVWKEDGGAFTDITTNVTDQKEKTTADIAALGTTTDYLYFGADVPIEAPYLEMGTPNTVETEFTQFEYGTGADAWTATTAFIDDTVAFSNSSDKIAGLAQDGIVLEPTVDVGANIKSAVMTGVGGGSARYWIRLRLATAGLSAGTTLKEVYAIPARPDIGMTAPDFTGRNAASVVQHVLMARIDKTPPVWHTAYAFRAIGQVRTMNITSARQGVSRAGPNTLVAGSGSGTTSSAKDFALISLTLGDDLRASSFAKAATRSTDIPEPVHFFERLTFNEEMRLDWLKIQGEYLQKDDECSFFYRWDREPWTKLGRWESFPIFINEIEPTQAGLAFESGVTINDAASTQPVIPSIMRVTANFEPTKGIPTPARDIQTIEEE